MNNKNNIWLDTFNKISSTVVKKPLGGKVNRPTTPVQVKAKSPQEYAAENQKLQDNKSMSTMEYMKKHHPQTYTQTTTNNQDGSVTNSRKDNNGNFVNVTTSTPKTKQHWTDAYKNNPEKINSAKQQMDNTKLELDDINDQIALIQKQMGGYGNTPGDQYNKKMLNYKLYELQQKQRSIQATYDKQQMGWKQLERRGYIPQQSTTTNASAQQTPQQPQQATTTNASAKQTPQPSTATPTPKQTPQPPTVNASTKSDNNVLNFKAEQTPKVKLLDSYKALGIQNPSDDLDDEKFMKEYEEVNNINTPSTDTAGMQAIREELKNKGVGNNLLGRWFQNIFRRPGYYV